MWSVLFQYYKAFKLGVLPDEGNVASQSNRGWKLLNLMDVYIDRAETQKLDEQRARGASGVR